MQRFKFHNMFRKQGETVASNVANPRPVSEDCSCGNMMTVILSNRLVCGVNDDKIQGCLLAEKRPILSTRHWK